MIKFIKRFFTFGKQEVDGCKPDTFAYFFKYSSSREKKKVFDRVIKKANQDQLDLVNRYKKVFEEGK